jgi:hypothetical protein
MWSTNSIQTSTTKMQDISERWKSRCRVFGTSESYQSRTSLCALWWRESLVKRNYYTLDLFFVWDEEAPFSPGGNSSIDDISHSTQRRYISYISIKTKYSRLFHTFDKSSIPNKIFSSPIYHPGIIFLGELFYSFRRIWESLIHDICEGCVLF